VGEQGTQESCRRKGEGEISAPFPIDRAIETGKFGRVGARKGMGRVSGRGGGGFRCQFSFRGEAVVHVRFAG